MKILGIETSCDETAASVCVDGKIISEKYIPSLDNKKIKLALKSFEGISTQIPPMFSAKKVNGRRLYQLARKGISIKRSPSEIHIKRIELLDYTRPCISFRVECSKGTYIRSLVETLGRDLGCLATMSSLRRLKVGEMKLNKDSCPMCRSTFIEKLPNYLRDFFANIIGESTFVHSSAPNLEDEHEFPPL